MSTQRTTFFDELATARHTQIGRTSLTTSLFVWLIGLYQKYVSPYKGFRCAHRVRHGGLSCSEAVRAIVLEEGLWCGRSQIRQRFQDCRAVAMVLRVERTNTSETSTPEATDEERRGDQATQSTQPTHECPEYLQAFSHGCNVCGPDCGGAVFASGVDGCSCTPW